MGNRGGALHNGDRQIVRTYKSRRWITCVLEFRGRKRCVMSPGRYTELFFLDEAVAFAAGHRPCAECRRQRYNAFKKAWQSLRTGPINADQIDWELHCARMDAQKRKLTYDAALDQLPNGSFVKIDGHPWLVWGDALLLWTPQAYARKISRSQDVVAAVLTPQPVVECFRQGYEPEIHGSWRSL